MTLPARLARIAFVLAVTLTACASTPPGAPLPMSELPTPVPPEEERAKGVGELIVSASGSASSATYGPWRVAGPGVDLTYVGEGTWTGTLAGRSVRVVATPGKIQGTGVNLYLFQEGETVTFRGLVGQREIWLTMTPTTLGGKVTAKGPGFELRRDAPDQWSGTRGPGARIFMTMKGEPAQYPAVLAPQFYLALLGVLM